MLDGQGITQGVQKNFHLVLSVLLDPLDLVSKQVITFTFIINDG